MSQQITEAFVKQYTANVFHLSQQKGTRLRPYVRNEMQKGKDAYYERIGAVAAQPKQGRHSDTPQFDTPHSRRRVSLVDFNWADLIDSADKIRTLIDPTNPYAQAASFAMGRAMDDVLIEAALGASYAGEEGTVPVNLPLGQQFAPLASVGNADNMTVDALITAKSLFQAADVDDSIPLYIACTHKQIRSLLEEEKLTSSDYANVKALVRGEVDSFMGFKFVRIERLPVVGTNEVSFDNNTGAAVAHGAGGSTTATGFRKCIAWAGDGLLLSVGQNPVGRISERADKNYSTQVYMEMAIGATRLEEEKVVSILCKE
jgi:hypothetical protein